VANLSREPGRRGRGGGMTSSGPVRADPYPWPYDGTVDISRVALVVGCASTSEEIIAATTGGQT